MSEKTELQLMTTAELEQIYEATAGEASIKQGWTWNTLVTSGQAFRYGKVPR